MANIVLLGGSNSILKDADLGTAAIKEGFDQLQDATTLMELALGATTSAQNLAQVVRFGAEFNDYDFVVTESNANDIHAHNHSGLTLSQTLDQIDLYYQRLADCAQRVLVLILSTEVEPIFNNVGVINERHAANCKKYGFLLFNMPEQLNKYKGAFPIQHDDLHPNRGVMLSLWGNILKLDKSCFKRTDEKPEEIYEYQYLSANDLAGDNTSILKRENSKFQEDFLTIDASLKIDNKYIGWEVMGVSTWSDAFSKLVISNKSKKIVKTFNDLNSFNELRESFIIDDQTHFSPCDASASQTELSLNVPRSTKAIAHTNLVGLLIRKSKPKSVQPSKALKEQPFPVIAAKIGDYFDGLSGGKISKINRLLEFKEYDAAIKLLTGVKSEDLTNKIRDMAVKIENSDLENAYKLMSCAFDRRPSGPFIKRKAEEMKKKLDLVVVSDSC